jgi:hypothetical protein
MANNGDTPATSSDADLVKPPIPYDPPYIWHLIAHTHVGLLCCLWGIEAPIIFGLYKGNFEGHRLLAAFGFGIAVLGSFLVEPECTCGRVYTSGEHCPSCGAPATFTDIGGGSTCNVRRDYCPHCGDPGE